MSICCQGQWPPETLWTLPAWFEPGQPGVMLSKGQGPTKGRAVMSRPCRKRLMTGLSNSPSDYEA